jgi:hypothetical protein
MARTVLKDNTTSNPGGVSFSNDGHQKRCLRDGHKMVFQSMWDLGPKPCLESAKVIPEHAADPSKGLRAMPTNDLRKTWTALERYHAVKGKDDLAWVKCNPHLLLNISSLKMRRSSEDSGRLSIPLGVLIVEGAYWLDCACRWQEFDACFG